MEVIKILEKLQSFGYIRLNKQSGNYFQIYCPFHNSGNERRPSCGVLLHEEYRNGRRYPEGFVHCFTCGHASTLPDAITEILKSKSISSTGIEWLKENVPGFEESPDFESLVPVDMMKSVQSKYAVDYVASLSKPEKEYVSEEELASYRFIVPYMYERKLTDEIIEKFDVGYDANWVAPGRKKPTPCITFPVRDRQGRTLFFCRRSIKGKFFNYPEYAEKPVYGIDQIPQGCKSVIICESVINCLTCWTYGYPAVALLGTGNAQQIQQLKELGVSEYVICMDGDDAGHRATKKLQNQLRHTAIIWTMSMPDNEDVNSIDRATFEKLYAERS